VSTGPPGSSFVNQLNRFVPRLSGACLSTIGHMNTDEQLFQAYGFLASKEVLYEGTGNAGLVDRKS